MLQPVNNPCQVYFELPPIGDRNQDTPHPQVPSSTERDTKNTDDDDGSAYRSLYHVLTNFGMFLPSTPLLYYPTVLIIVVK